MEDRGKVGGLAFLLAVSGAFTGGVAVLALTTGDVAMGALLAGFTIFDFFGILFIAISLLNKK